MLLTSSPTRSAVMTHYESKVFRQSQYLGCGAPGRRLEYQLSWEEGVVEEQGEQLMLQLTQHLYGVFSEAGRKGSDRCRRR